jgi:NADH-quinone oxidoreductase subunit H
VIALGFFYEWIDRKLYAKLQNRVGPLYTGPLGILQPFADFIKLLSKEDVTPAAADRFLFNAAPIVALATMLTAILLLPITSVAGILSFDGDLIFAIALLTIYCIIVFLSGVSSRNRFAAVGAERAVMQLVGYEIPMTLAIVAVALGTRTLRIGDVIQAQATRGAWFILGPQAIGFAIFIIAFQAELERIPFDIPEAEQELVAGWLTEFSGRKLALFRLSTDLELVYAAGLASALYLGGPVGPSLPLPSWLAALVYFLVKSVIVLIILTTIRTVFARLRIDQMVNFSWKYLVPISLLQLVLTRVVI